MESLLGTGDVHGDYCSILPGEWQGKHRAEAAPESMGKRAGASIRQREQGNGELALALPSQGIAHQGSGTAAGVAQPGDQILRLFHSQPVESAVLPYHKLCYALFPDMMLDLGGQRWQNIAGGVPVPDEKTAAVWHKQSLFLLHFIVKIIR